MSAAIQYKGDLTCSIQSGDLDRAIEWYKNTLGFELLYRVEEIGWCEMRTPVNDVSLGISQVENPTVKGGATLVFGVKDIDAARKDVESKGVKFDGDTMTIEGMVRLAVFYDADGNKLMFSQSLQH